MKDIAEHILDITQNSITAKSGFIEIKIHISDTENHYQLIIIDNGVGMDKNKVKQVVDPFYTSRSTRKVGMGIPFLIQNAEITGGQVLITSKPGEGTIIQASFVKDSIDLIPEGDIASAIVLLVATNTDINFEFEYATQKGNYVFDTREIKKILGEVPIANIEIRNYLTEMIQENIDELMS